MRSRKWTHVMVWTGAFLAFLAIMVFRRPDQFLHPYTWVEEGRDFVPLFVQDGWKSIFIPASGYVILPSKIIFFIAIKLSFSHFPVIAYWLTLLFEFLVCVAVARSPTSLRLPWLCAASLLLLPINSEVYAVSEYAFWFGSLLIFLSALWRDDAIDQVALRALFTVVGGLSSPMTVILAPIFIVRALRLRDRRETFICAIAVLWAVVQVALVYLTTPVPTPGAALAAISIPDVLAKFVGWYMFFPGIEGIAIGAWLGAAIVVVALLGIRRSPNFGLLVLGYIFLAAVAASIARAPLQWVSAYTDGPRYFFYPYLLLSWLLIYGLASAKRIEGILIALVLLLSLRQTYLYGQRRHETLDWAQEVAQCAALERYVFPIHYDGVLDHAWHMELKGRECRRLVRRSLTRT